MTPHNLGTQYIDLVQLEKNFPQTAKIILPESSVSCALSQTQELTVVASHHAIQDICLFLRDDKGFNYLCDLSAVDRWPQNPRFEVNLHLLALPHATPNPLRLRVKVHLDAGQPRMPSLSSIWPTASWYERETRELFGIDFTNHAKPAALLLPPNWKGAPPLRRDSREQGNQGPNGAQPSRIQEVGGEVTQSQVRLNNTPLGDGLIGFEIETQNQRITHCIPHTGYLHTGIEKSCEQKTYQQIIPLAERVDYLAPLCSSLAYVLAVERLVLQPPAESRVNSTKPLEVPLRAQYLRVILAELSRIASHLAWLGSSSLVLDEAGLFHLVFRDREGILDLFEMCTGQRIMTNYFRVGGLARDAPRGFKKAAQHLLTYLSERIRIYERLCIQNPLWKKRTVGLGIIRAQDAIAWGLGGPCLRACGVAWDLRQSAPYTCYDHFEFEIPLGENGDTYDRYRCRFLEIKQSLHIIDQALTKLPSGPVMIQNPKIVPPLKKDSQQNITALIHHFKLWEEGFCPPPGEIYQATESPRGELGVYINSDGSGKPRRVHFRTPSFAHLQALSLIVQGLRTTDIKVVISSLDLVLGEIER